MCSAREQTRKLHITLTLVRLQPWSLAVFREGMCVIKDHVHYRINVFRESNNNGRPFELKKKMEEKEAR